TTLLYRCLFAHISLHIPGTHAHSVALSTRHKPTRVAQSMPEPSVCRRDMPGLAPVRGSVSGALGPSPLLSPYSERELKPLRQEAIKSLRTAQSMAVQGDGERGSILRPASQKRSGVSLSQSEMSCLILI